MTRFIDLTGRTFGRLLVIERAANYIQPNGGVIAKWSCMCSCGGLKTVCTASLKNGHVKSCGCLSKEITKKNMTKHGKTGTRLYGIWKNMRERCNNSNKETYKN